MANRQVISTKNAPEAIGAYSQAIVSCNLLFTAGQIAIDPKTGVMADDDIKTQTHQVLKNLKAIAEAAGTSLEKAVKITIFLQDMNHFGTVNEIYSTYFSAAPPARAAVEVSRLPKDALIEIEGIFAV